MARVFHKIWFSDMQSSLLDCHGFKGILELSTTVATNPVRSSADREDATEIAVMTAKQEVEQISELHISHLLKATVASATTKESARAMPSS